MQHLKTRILRFSGGGPPVPSNLAALLTCIFICPASRRGHHAGRVCHLGLDFKSQPLHRLLDPGLWHTRLFYTFFTRGIRHPQTPGPFSGCVACDGHDLREGLHTFQAFFQKSILIPVTTYVKILRQCGPGTPQYIVASHLPWGSVVMLA